MKKIFMESFHHSGRLCDKSVATLLNEFLDENPSVELKDFKVAKSGSDETLFCIFEVIDKKGHAMKILDDFIFRLERVDHSDGEHAETLKRHYLYMMRNDDDLSKYDTIIRAIKNAYCGEYVFKRLSGFSFQSVYDDMKEDLNNEQEKERD